MNTITELNRTINMLMAHPDNEPNSEFADRIDSLIDLKQQLTLTDVGCSLPSKKDTMLFAIEHTKTEMPEFNETDKIIFRQGVLNMHTWISENKIK